MPGEDFDINAERFINYNPVAGYQISDQEVGATSYYGYLSKDGKWYIMRSVTTGATIAYTYFRGNSGYTTAWAARPGLGYDTYDNIF